MDTVVKRSIEVVNAIAERERDGTLDIHVYNTTSMTSFFYRWYPNAWNPPGAPSRSRCSCAPFLLLAESAILIIYFIKIE